MALEKESSTSLSLPVLLVGLGTSGKAVLEYFLSQHMTCVIVDDAPQKAKDYIQRYKSGQKVEALSIDELMKKYSPRDFLKCVLSPGIPPYHPIVKWCSEHGVPLTSEIEIALQEIRKKSVGNTDVAIIGVTGTNGKTTTVELITHLLNTLGIPAAYFGNIGRPLIELVTPSAAIDKKLEGGLPLKAYIVELSSYQIERISEPVFTSCVWLNLAPDHLEWHGTFDSYKRAKEKLLTLLSLNQRNPPYAVLHTSLPSLKVSEKIRPIYYGIQNSSEEKALDVYAKEGEFVLHGKRASLPQNLCSPQSSQHDIENFLAAAVIVHMLGIPIQDIATAYESFKKGPHRIQYVASLPKIDFYDDSKGTNVHATAAAIRAVSPPIVLIAGGVHKGYPYEEWRSVCEGRVSMIVAIGQAKEAIREDLQDVVPVSFADSLENAVHTAVAEAQKVADKYEKRVTILLSPGCSSFDMFKDYKDRGEQYQRIIRSLVEQSLIS